LWQNLHGIGPKVSFSQYILLGLRACHCHQYENIPAKDADAMMMYDLIIMK
jgi:hypothetical protein